MKKDLTKIFIDEIYDNPPKKIYQSNKTIVKSIDDTWSADLLDLVDYGVKNNRGYRYILVIIDNFSKYGWAIPLKNKYASTIKDSFNQIITNSKRKPNLIETDEGKEFANKIFETYLKSQNIKRYSRYSSKGAVFAERFNRTIRNLLKKPVFENGDANWIDIIDSIIKKNNNTVHSSTKMTPIQASKVTNQKKVLNNLQDKRSTQKPKFKLGDLVRTADIDSTFAKGDTTNWSNKLYMITEVFHETIPTYHIDFLPERYNQSILKKSKLTLSKNDQVMSKLNLEK